MPKELGAIEIGSCDNTIRMIQKAYVDPSTMIAYGDMNGQHPLGKIVEVTEVLGYPLIAVKPIS